MTCNLHVNILKYFAQIVNSLSVVIFACIHFYFLLNDLIRRLRAKLQFGIWKSTLLDRLIINWFILILWTEIIIIWIVSFFILINIIVVWLIYHCCISTKTTICPLSCICGRSNWIVPHECFILILLQISIRIFNMALFAHVLLNPFIIFFVVLH